MNFLFLISVFAEEIVEEVTVKQLSILSALCYYNEVENNVSEMIKINMEDILEPEEIKNWENWEIVDCTINDNHRSFGFSCFTFKKGSNIVITARGTDGGVLYENWRYFIPNHEHPQAQYMKKYILHLLEKKIINNNTNIYITGHSLGGYLSLYGTGVLMQIDELKGQFVKVVTFNGLGLGSYTDPSILKQLYSLDPKKIINYRIKGDLVSYIGTHITTLITLQPAKDKSMASLSVHSISQFLNRDLPLSPEQKAISA